MFSMKTHRHSAPVQLEGKLLFRQGSSPRESGVFLLSDEGELEVLATTLEASVPLGEAQRAPSGLYAKITGLSDGHTIAATTIETNAAMADPHTPMLGESLVHLYETATTMEMEAAASDPHTPLFGISLVDLFETASAMMAAA